MVISIFSKNLVWNALIFFFLSYISQIMQTDMHLKQKPRTMLTFPLNFENTERCYFLHLFTFHKNH